MTLILGWHASNKTSLRAEDPGGFSLIELLVGIAFLSVGMLGLASMFLLGYRVVNDSGKTTMALTAARQIIEGIRSLPYNNLASLNGFDTTNSATIPGSGPEREIARRWRYTLAGEGNGFTFTTTEKAQWTSLSTSVTSANSNTSLTANFGARGTVTVADQSTSLRLVTIVIMVPGSSNIFRIATLVSRM